MTDKPQTKREQLAEANREHNRRIEALRSEHALSREINAEYADHQKKLSEILGADDVPVVGSSGGRTV